MLIRTEKTLVIGLEIKILNTLNPKYNSFMGVIEFIVIIIIFFQSQFIVKYYSMWYPAIILLFLGIAPSLMRLRKAIDR